MFRLCLYKSLSRQPWVLVRLKRRVYKIHSRLKQQLRNRWERNRDVYWGMKEEAVPKTSFLSGVLTNTSKFFLLYISDSSCWEDDAPAIEIAWKKQKGWEAALTWARSYGQVNTQKERDCWDESGMRGISLLCYSCSWWWMSSAESWEACEHISLSPPFFPTLPWNISKMACSPQNDPFLKEDWRNLDWFGGSTLASPVRSQHNSDNFTLRRCWKMGKIKELAACMKFFRKHKSVPSVHCEQLNPFHYSKKDEVIFWWAKKKSVA